MTCYGGYDDAPEGAGLVLAFSDYDRLTTTCPEAAQIVLDIIAGPGPPGSPTSPPPDRPGPEQRPADPVRARRRHARHVEQR
ncbi:MULTISPECIES: hypothetical protein [unclassified Streptomyces]|uniref:hypothetical protein n=1 Tax=unclassified Streptomyces TaxID=2593676 RepID=UPI0027E3DB30|nr:MULTISPECIES: hypothetical protein [unclassified Streptomyces]